MPTSAGSSWSVCVVGGTSSRPGLWLVLPPVRSVLVLCGESHFAMGCRAEAAQARTGGFLHGR